MNRIARRLSNDFLKEQVSKIMHLFHSARFWTLYEVRIFLVQIGGSCFELFLVFMVIESSHCPLIGFFFWNTSVPSFSEVAKTHQMWSKQLPWLQQRKQCRKCHDVQYVCAWLRHSWESSNCLVLRQFLCVQRAWKLKLYYSKEQTFWC